MPPVHRCGAGPDSAVRPHHRAAAASWRRHLAYVLVLLCTCACAGSARAADWPGYQIIEWQQQNAAQRATLKRIGVDAGAVIADRDGTGTPLPIQTAPLQRSGMRWYVENIATDFYSAYHRWTPGKPVNWRFLAVQRQYRADPHGIAALIRHPSLSDPVWQARIDARIAAIVRQQRHFHPLFYNLADESGIADLSAFWDFDFSPRSLSGMRAWLRTRYGSLAALNAEWGTHFADWRAVRPETTIQAMRRTDGNFASWADFKAWMDKAYADALRRGTNAVHAADPHAIAAIEGAQIPGWGGYNYTRLVHAVDLIEGGGDARLPLSLNPHLIMLATSFGATPRDIHAIWQGVLRGRRGLILWNDGNGIVRPDGSLTARGRIYASVFATLHRVAPLLMAARLHVDPVAILYSQASFRTQWMLDQQPKGLAWIDRDAETELGDNAFRRAMRGYRRALAQRDIRPRFVSPAMLPGLRDSVLILPDTLALSPASARAIAAFARRGGVVIADRQPGVFDGHSRRLPFPTLAPGIAHLVPPTDVTGLTALLTQAHVAAPFHVAAPRHDVALYVYRRGDTTIVALQRREATRAAETISLILPHAMRATDLLSGKSLGRRARITLRLNGLQPAFIRLD